LSQIIEESKTVPIFFFGVFVIAACVCVIFILAIKKRVEPISKALILDLVLFTLSATSLIISWKLFWNMGIYADDYGSSPTLVSGGTFWLYMNWLKQLLLFVITLILGVRLFK
jgi:predicted membrane protein